VIAVVGTIIGHYNHSNLRVDLGPLKYVLNGPEMHQWHHVHPDAGPPDKNFAINLALWDWLFGTAFLPSGKQAPARLGFTGIELFPRSIALQEAWPLSALLLRRARPRPSARI
jgi:sterol desaturase/sphingolipid hydroxylase (fatty acid hydroxylase superfamily)